MMSFSCVQVALHFVLPTECYYREYNGFCHIGIKALKETP